MGKNEGPDGATKTSSCSERVDHAEPSGSVLITFTHRSSAARVTQPEFNQAINQPINQQKPTTSSKQLLARGSKTCAAARERS